MYNKSCQSDTQGIILLIKKYFMVIYLFKGHEKLSLKGFSQ